VNCIEDEAPFLKQLLTLIPFQFGDQCEVVLHDLTQDYNHIVVLLINT
jgi:predicted transcriptional regulator YheO